MTTNCKLFNENHYVLWGVILLLTGLFIRLLFLEAPSQVGDDIRYFFMAGYYSPQVIVDAQDQVPFRSGILVPLALLQNMFGYNIYAYYAFSLGSYVLMLLSIYIISIEVSGLSVGIASLFIAVSSSLVLNQTSTIVSDVPNLAFMLFAFALFLSADRIKRRRLTALLISLSAIAAFIAYLIRMPNLLFLVCIPLYEIFQRRSVKKSVLFGIVFLILISLELIFYFVITGNPFIRLSMSSHSVFNWGNFQPVIHMSEYILVPFARFTIWTTGWFLLVGGMIGFIISIYRKNWPLVALISGASILFILYSFSITSISPLKLALPLKIQYIMAFIVILAISTAYAIVSITSCRYFEKWKYSHIILYILLLGTVVFMQAAEIPRAVSGSILWGNDSFFTADRLLRDILKYRKIPGVVYTYPIKSLKMFPHFNKLDLRRLDLSAAPEAGQTILISKTGIHKDIQSDVMRGNMSRVQIAQTYLQRFHPNWDILLETEDIILAKIITPTAGENLICDFTDSRFINSWESTSESELQINKTSGIPTEIHLPVQDSPYYIYTFRGKSESPVKGWDPLFEDLRDGDILKFELSYKLKRDVKSMMIYISDYSNKRKENTISNILPNEAGTHEYTDMIRLNADKSSFRIFLRLNNKAENSIIFNYFKVSTLSSESCAR